ncbi:hypothetical protein [Gemmatimonas sp.]|jgi:hypothetical protein|uniref:hypothetical protein n=1 Tax=Gemmatimonas sp. TaxID=1962908 RepID=UPI0037BFAEB6
MTSAQTPSGTIAGSVLPIRRAEELIATLPGVLSVRIVPNETGAVDEIHVLTTDMVLPKNSVRNIESALMAQLGLRVNHRKISIATTLGTPRAADLPPASSGLSAMAGGVSSFSPPAAMPAVAPAAAPIVSPAPAVSAAASVASASPGGHMGGTVRANAVLSPMADAASAGRRVLTFEDVEVRRSRSRGVVCRVTLSRDGQEFVGESEGQESERSRIDLAARSTLLAIVSASKATMGGERSLALEGSTTIDAFDREFVFVSVAARVGREPVVLTGSCEVRDSAETSAVLAVLDATNRWMHIDR